MRKHLKNSSETRRLIVEAYLSKTVSQSQLAEILGYTVRNRQKAFSCHYYHSDDF